MSERCICRTRLNKVGEMTTVFQWKTHNQNGIALQLLQGSDKKLQKAAKLRLRTVA